MHQIQSQGIPPQATRDIRSDLLRSVSFLTLMKKGYQSKTIELGVGTRNLDALHKNP